MLRDFAEKYYFDQNYNCAETVIRAANEYYDLGIDDHDMILMAGFGAGMQTGNVCGTLLSGLGVLSLKYVEKKAHESADIQPAAAMLINRFQEKFDGTLLCCDIKAKNFREGIRCLNTVLTACDIIENVIKEYDAEKKAEETAISEKA